MLRYLTAGESHGQALVVIVEGVPAGLEVTAEQVQNELARRRLGYGRGPRQRFEQDEIVLLGGIRHGRTGDAVRAHSRRASCEPDFDARVVPGQGPRRNRSRDGRWGRSRACGRGKLHGRMHQSGCP